MTADTRGSFPPGSRINHTPESNNLLPKEIGLPYVSRFEYAARTNMYHWEVTQTLCLLCTQGRAKRRGKAVKEAREALHKAYIDFCEQLAEVEGKKFDE